MVCMQSTGGNTIVLTEEQVRNTRTECVMTLMMLAGTQTSGARQASTGNRKKIAAMWTPKQHLSLDADVGKGKHIND